ncbi:MAG: tetratricopeptide repeat protein [Flavobacteriales bacterium]|nr:tetratricopeptide repeat protein [Flavobacteriales bacterium]
MIRNVLLGSAFALCMISCTDTPNDDPTQQPEVTFRTALDSLNEAIINDPNNIELYLERCNEWLVAGKHDEAFADLERVLRIDTANAEAYNQRGNLHFLRSEFSESIEDFKACLFYDENHTDCLLKKAELDMLLRNYDQAILNINKALRVDQNIPQAYFLKGMLYKETGDSAAAASSYATAIDLDPEFYDAYIQAALLYAGAGDDLALEYYNSALDVKPNSTEALYDKGMYLQETGFRDPIRYQQALQCYREIEAVDSTNAAAAFNQGYIYLEYLSHYDSASVKFGDAIRKYPMYFQAFYNRGLCFESMDMNDLALNDYNKALAIRPDYTPAAKAKGRLVP